jgi:fatty acid desaturase
MCDSVPSELGSEGNLNNAEYIRTVRPSLPTETLRPHAGALLPIAIHMTVVAACIVAARYTAPIYWPLLGLVAGLSRGSLSFLAHDVAHRSVVTHRYLLYPLEVVLWGLVFMPATVWRRLHHAHHIHTNADDDPERRWLESELSNPTALVSAALLTPNRTLKYNVLCMLYWVTWTFRHVIAVFYGEQTKPGFAQAKPRYSTDDVLRIAFELVFIVAAQIGIWKLVGHGLAYFWVSIVPTLVASALVSWYFFTNHGLKPVGDGSDVLAATTSVTVPKFCDVLHSNFSYHTEHHLFPAMNPKYYPLVREQLRRRFPDQFHCIPIGEAWTGLWNSAIGAVRSAVTPSPRRRARSSKPAAASATSTAQPQAAYPPG